MALLPKIENPIRHAIEAKDIVQGNRSYLGMSGIGKKCSREQWFGWRWAIMRIITPRLQRIFNRGDIEEPRIIKDLTDAGMIVFDDQAEVVHLTGHSKGHIDGKVLNVPGAEKTVHLAEFKTMKAAKFNKLLKTASTLGFEAALKEMFSEYWCQIQVYMGYLELTRCLYVITNKDTEDRIYERVKFYPKQFEFIKERIMDIVCADVPPIGISQREDWFECKMCAFKNVCFGHVLPEKSCRMCAGVVVLDDGVWGCSFNENKQLSIQDQKDACSQYNQIEIKT